MRNYIKTFLGKVGLLKPGRVLHSFVKGLTPRVLLSEIQSRLVRNGMPLPPSRLIFFVIGSRWRKTFLESGKIITDAMNEQLAANNIKMDSFTSVLDFGCGCGRLLRHLTKLTNARLSGCDYNAELIEWSKKNLTFAEFTRNSLAPPLPYPDESFDFIFARSVFTHLNESLQKEWMNELRRVLKPNGYLYFTMHGKQFFDQLSADEIERLYEGNLIVFEAKEEGHNVCSSFELEPYVRKNLTDGFDFIGCIPGTSDAHLQQDAYIFQRI